jgi:ABC-2 type transport system permease protein
MIATSVTTEKSNRSIEVLVTSIDSKYLLFGKVIAGTLAVVVQMGSILAAALIGYSINKDAWGNKLDAFLDIPSDVLITFAVFGIGGFLFYAFCYGAVELWYLRLRISIKLPEPFRWLSWLYTLLC